MRRASPGDIMAVEEDRTPPGKAEDEVRELHCACGNRLMADEALVYQVLEHAHEVHPEMDLTEEQAREMVATQASDTEDASY